MSARIARFHRHLDLVGCGWFGGRVGRLPLPLPRVSDVDTEDDWLVPFCDGLLPGAPSKREGTGEDGGSGTRATSCCAGGRSGNPGRDDGPAPKKPAIRMAAADVSKTPAAAAITVNTLRRRPVPSTKIGLIFALRLPTVKQRCAPLSRYTSTIGSV